MHLVEEVGVIDGEELKKTETKAESRWVVSSYFPWEAGTGRENRRKTTLGYHQVASSYLFVWAYELRQRERHYDVN